MIGIAWCITLLGNNIDKNFTYLHICIQQPCPETTYRRENVKNVLENSWKKCYHFDANHFIKWQGIPKVAQLAKICLITLLYIYIYIYTHTHTHKHTQTHTHTHTHTQIYIWYSLGSIS